MKGERTLVDEPFRYGGFFHDYEKDVEQWHDILGKSMDKCYCCGGKMRNVRSQNGTLLKRNYPYIAVFKLSKGKHKGKNWFKPLCRACAYGYGRGVIEMDGNKYFDYYTFDEKKYKAGREE